MSNTRLAIVIVIVAETMLFAGLVGMYLVFRLSAPGLAAARPAPPAGRRHRAQLARAASPSLVPLTRAARLRAGMQPRGGAACRVAALLGALFLAVQGVGVASTAGVTD